MKNTTNNIVTWVTELARAWKSGLFKRKPAPEIKTKEELLCEKRGWHLSRVDRDYCLNCGAKLNRRPRP